ncbi:MAG: hypothetical protein ACOC5T_07735 [Elusimicrobiota bacterium]
MEIEETEEYDIDLDKIEKPEKPKPIFVDKDMEEVDDPDDAQFVVFDQEEYAKISAMVKLTGNYKEIILDQEELINTKIDIINSYKEYLKLEIEKSKSYRELWANAENQKRYEQWRSD